MDCHWSLGYRQSQQVSRTLFSILADLYNAVVWMVSILLTFEFSGDRSKRTNYYYHFSLLSALHTRWWFLIEVWVTASHFKSLGLLLFCPISTCYSLDGLHSSSYISKSPSLCTSPSITVPSTPTTTGVSVSFFSSLASSLEISMQLIFHFVFWLFLFCWCSCCLYCFWWL